ncbi:MAG: hypothetical protein ACK449_16095 [Planctomycetota bacterium]
MLVDSSARSILVSIGLPLMGWNVSDTAAVFLRGSLELHVQTLPDLKIRVGTADHSCTWAVQPREDSVELGSKLPAPNEAYSRIDDYIVAFPQRFPWPFSYQLDVRVQPSSSNLLVLELWLSVQTSMLECNPQLSLLPLESRETWTCHPQFICSADRRSALAVHPLDLEDSHWIAKGSGGIERLDMFGRFMEKGVIRRGRLLLVASTSSISEKQMKDLCSDFAASHLPLTA